MKKTPIYNFSLTFLLFFLGIRASVSLGAVYNFTEGNKINLLSDPDESVNLKLNLIRNAKHHIHIITYYFDGGEFPLKMAKELNLAYQRGVNIRILTNTLATLPKDFKGIAKKALFQNYNPNSKNTLSYLSLLPDEKLAITNNVHEKIFLVDGKIAITGGRNTTDDVYTSKDLEVTLEGPLVNQIQDHFEKMFEFMSALKADRYCLIFNKNCIERINKSKFSSSDSDYYYEQPRFESNIKARVLTNETLLNQYKNNYWGEERFNQPDDILDIVTTTPFSKLRAYNYYFIPTSKYAHFIEDKLAEGKHIELTTNSLVAASSLSDMGYLYNLPTLYEEMKKGLIVNQWLGNKSDKERYHYSYIHEKILLFDNNHAIIGSHNYNAGSTSVSSELVIDFYSENLVSKLVKIFDEEKKDTQLFNQPTLESIKSELKTHKRKIRTLHNFFIRNIIRQVY